MECEKNLAEIVEFLSTVKGFGAISKEDLKSLAGQIEVNTYHHDDSIIRKDEHGDTMHVIWKGRVRVPVNGPDGRLKLEVTLEAGCIVGEMALLTHEPRSADVISVGTTKTLAFNRKVIEPFLYTNPELARFLTEVLSERIEEDQTLQQVGKYRLGRELGQGATSIVYEASHNTLSRLVAVKMLSHTLVYDKVFLKRFLQEAEIIAGLAHPNIVQIYDLEKAYGTHFIIMEKIQGTSLDKILEERKQLSPEESCGILRQLASALAHAHGKGIVHRDVKPANCVISADGQVKLMDFGISRKVKDEEAARKSLEGSPAYIAPEVIAGKEVDGRADIYSLGAMAFKLVTGRTPFRFESVPQILKAHLEVPPPDPRDLCPDLPEKLATFINGALVKDADERLSDGDWDLIQELLDVETYKVPRGEIEAGAERETVVLSYPRDLAPKVQDFINALHDQGVTAVPYHPNSPAPAASSDRAEKTMKIGEVTEKIEDY